MSKIFRTFIRNLFFEPVQSRPQLDPLPGLNAPTAAPKIPNMGKAADATNDDIARAYKRFKNRDIASRTNIWDGKSGWTLNQDLEP